MSEIREFFRHCPSCGRRFHIKLVSKEKISEEEVTDSVPPRQADSKPGLEFARRVEDVDISTPLTAGQPVYVDVKEFNYRYKCTHCGHEWTEIHEKDKTSRT